VKAALPAGSVHVGCSTVSPQAARAVAIAHAAHGSEYVSAPVFARPDGMALGQATIPISGPAEATARVKPLLEATSTGVFEFGQDVGAVSQLLAHASERSQAWRQFSHR
jgi:3-hydroxyisobutyrate dehydrogenase-like beta-hydroxyacid dehydrogenase